MLWLRLVFERVDTLLNTASLDRNIFKHKFFLGFSSTGKVETSAVAPLLHHGESSR